MKNCLLCKCSEFKKLFSNTLIECRNCGFVSANLEISNEELKKLYSKKYFHGDEYFDYYSDRVIIQKNFLKRIKKIDIATGSSILDIGCAYGFFGDLLMRKYNNQLSYTGIDISNDATEYGRKQLGLNLITGDYLKQKFPNKFSHVFMWDVIEHLKHPELFIQKISRDISEGGLIYLTTADINSFMAKIRGRKWRMIHPPSHLHYFSSKTIKLLLKNNGFSEIKISYPPIYRSIKQIYYSLFLLKREKQIHIFKKLFNHLPSNLSVPLNTFDIMFVKARKGSESSQKQ
ncbi:MAG: class I SAM-dependent methyltransferase [Bacteroidetes bacterium]|nr:MAG: class I SAM-dependent methyltransferase [Bacteroidota bacterium]